jgi:membrane protein implicated in regulation of membrane protease activity
MSVQVGGEASLDGTGPVTRLSTMDPITIAFLIGGIALLASEVVVPSLVAGFFGVAAILTGGLHAIGLVDSLPATLFVWAVTSVALVLPFRPMMQKLAGKAQSHKDRTDVDEDRDSMGEVVEVVEDVSEENDIGRIRFQGTTWQARCTTGTLKAGERAQLVYRQGSLWVVEPVAVEGAHRELFAVDSSVDQSVEQTVDAAQSKKR